MANISDFKAQLLGGGARANQFEVGLQFPGFSGGALAGTKAKFLCKAASIPAATVENVAVQYRGRPVNFAGERTFSPWTVTVYNDTGFSIRTALENWSAGIISLNTTNGITNPVDYQIDLSVKQLDRNGGVIRSYKFADAYPTEVSAIDLDYEATGIETFTVTFQYNYWTAADK